MTDWTLYLGLAATLLAFWLSQRFQQACGGMIWLHPVLIATIVLVGLLTLLEVDYASYKQANQPLLMLLGPATVALAVPLFEQRKRLRHIWWPIFISVTLGTSVAIASAVGLAALVGLEMSVIKTLIAKSVTTPIAMGVAEQVGGIPEVAAAVVLLVGIIGAIVCVWLLALLKVTDPAAKGIAIGLSAHGVGTARAFEIDREVGAYSGLAMGLTGIATALMAPIVVWLIGFL